MQFGSQKYFVPAASIVRVCRSVDKYQSFERTVSSIIYIFPSKSSNLLNPTLHASRFARPQTLNYVVVHLGLKLHALIHEDVREGTKHVPGNV
jgi:hypothetical protein